MNFGLEKKFVHTRSHSLRRGFFGEFSSVSFLVCFCLFIYFLDDDYIGCRYWNVIWLILGISFHFLVLSYHASLLSFGVFAKYLFICLHHFFFLVIFQALLVWVLLISFFFFFSFRDPLSCSRILSSFWFMMFGFFFFWIVLRIRFSFYFDGFLGVFNWFWNCKLRITCICCLPKTFFLENVILIPSLKPSFQVLFLTKF